MPKIVAVGHPILDLVAPVEWDVLEKYGLEEDSQILAGPRQQPLFGELEQSGTTRRVPGGSVLNSLRAAVWWTRHAGQTPCSCVILGTVGKDTTAKMLQEEARLAGVVTEFFVDEVTPTGKCCILVHEQKRTMVTDLGAAATISLGAPGAVEEHLVPLLGNDGGQVVYTSAFYFKRDPEGACRLASECKRRYEIAFSFAAVWAASSPIVAEMLGHSKIVFGTLVEAQACCVALGGPSDEDGIARFLQAHPGQHDRWVVITNGPLEVFFASSAGVVRFPVSALDKSLIVDDNGAGDAFAGAFLACYINGGDAKDCIYAGLVTAREVLQNVGCQFAQKVPLTAKRSFACFAWCS